MNPGAAQRVDAQAGVRLLRELVATPSVSGTEQSAIGVLVRHAIEMGFDTEVDEAGNGLAHRGAPAAEALIHIVLLGHIDTVPGHIPVRIENGVLHGRGSVDAKGPLAAMLIGAALADLPAGVRVTVAGAVGEETADSPGARHLAGRLRPHACIIGEPSGWDGVTLGYKGRLIGQLSCRRPCSHTAGPDPSAADEVLAWWSRIGNEIAKLNNGKVGMFERVQASVRTLNTRSDGLSDTALLESGFRLPPGVKPGDLQDRLESLAGAGCAAVWDGHETAYATDRSDPVVRAISQAIRVEGGVPRPKLKTGTADLNVVAPIWRCPIAAYGPGDSRLDHTPREHIRIDDFERGWRVLARAITGLAEDLTNGVDQSN